MVHRCWDEVQKKGPVHQVVSCFYKHTPPQETYPYYRGAIDLLHCDAIHAVDSLRYYAGLSDVKSVASEIRNLDSWYAVSFNSLVCFENGAVGILLANWRTGRRLFKFEFHSYGASGYADIDGEGKVWVDNGDQPVLTTNFSQEAGSDAVHIAQGFCAQSRAFIDAVKSGKQLHNNLQDSVKTMKLGDMIFENVINK